MEASFRILIMVLASMCLVASAAVLQAKNGLYDPQSLRWSGDPALQHKSTSKVPFAGNKQVLEKRKTKNPEPTTSPTSSAYERGRDDIFRHTMELAHKLGRVHRHLDPDADLP